MMYHRTRFYLLGGGFSLIELLVVLALLGILVGTAVPTYREYRQRSYDLLAKADLRNVKLALRAEGDDPGKRFSVMLFGQQGPKTLPPPLSHVSLSEKVVASWILKIPFVGGDLTYVVIRHPLGKYEYSWLEFLNARFETRRPL